MGFPARSTALLRALDKGIVPPDQPVECGLLLTTLGGNGILPLLVMPFILGVTIYTRIALPLLLVPILAFFLNLGVWMDTGPIVSLAASMVAAIGVVVILFQTVSFGPSLVVMDRVMAGAGRVSHS